MSEVNPIQRNQPVHEIMSDEQLFANTLTKLSNTVQLHYDEAEEITKNDIEQAVNKMNEHILGINAQLEYRIHEGTDRIMVKLINIQSKEIIKEIPPEKMLDLVAGIWERVGLVVDKLE